MNKKQKLIELQKDIEALSISIEVLKQKLGEIDRIIQEDGFIPTGLNSETVSSLQAIEFLNNSCIEKLKEIDSTTMFPDTITALSSIVSKYIKNDEEKEAFDSLRTELLLYKGESVSTAESLTSIQAELIKINIDDLSPEEYQSQTTKYQALLNAIQEKDPGKRLSYMVDLKDSFDASLLISLLATGDVYRSEAVKTDNDDVITERIAEERQESGQLSSKGNNSETDTITVQPSSEGISEQVSEEENIEIHQSFSGSQDTEEQSANESVNNIEEVETSFFEMLKEAGAVVHQSKDYSVSESPRAKKEFQRKKFQNELSECGDYLIDLFKRCVHTGAITARMFGRDEETIDTTSAGLNRLYEKGLLRKYEIHEMGSFYAPSTRALKACSNQGIQAFLEVKPDSVITNKLYNSNGRNAFIVLLLKARTYEIMALKYDSFLEHGVFQNNAFITEFVTTEDSGEEGLIFTGIITDDKENISVYLSKLWKKINSSKNDVIICGINEAQAGATAKALLELFSEEFAERRVFLYDYSKELFLDYYSGSESFPKVFMDENDNLTDSEDAEFVDRKPDVNSADNHDQHDNICAAKQNSSKDENNKNVSITDYDERAEDKCETNSTDDIRIEAEKTTEETKEEPDTSEKDVIYSFDATTTPAEYASQLLAACKEERRDASDKEIENLVQLLLKEARIVANGSKVYNSLTQAFYLSKSVPENKYPCTHRLFKQLQIAVKYPGEEADYSGIALNELFDRSSDNGALIVAGYMMGLFLSETAHDYTLISQTNDILEHNPEFFDGLGDVKTIVHLLYELRSSDDVKSGYTNAVVLALDDTEGHELQVQSLRDMAKRLIDEPDIKIKMKGMPELKRSLFGTASELGRGVEVVAYNKIDRIGYVKEILNKYTLFGSSLSIKKDIVDKLVDHEWKKATVGKTTSGMPLEVMGRRLVIEEIKKRLSAMNQWVMAVEMQKESIPEKLRTTRETLINMIPKVRNQLDSLKKENSIIVLDRALEFMEDRLNGKDLRKELSLTADFLRTGFIALDKQYIPIMDESYNQVRYYELWRSMLHHIADPTEDLLIVRNKIISEETSELFDNYSQRELIDQYLEMMDIHVKPIAVNDYEIQSAKENAERYISKFKDKLELAYAYNQIFESDKEDIQYIIEEHSDKFFNQKNFGAVHQFIQALEEYENELADSRRSDLKANLMHLVKRAYEEGETHTELLDEASRLLSDPSQKYGLVEEYLNRFEVGERELITYSRSKDQEGSYQDFISDKVFLELLQLCVDEKGKTMSSSKSSIAGFVRRRIPNSWGANEKKRSEELLGCWPNRVGIAKPERIETLFKLLSFDVKKAEKVSQDGRTELWKLYCNPAEKNVSDYRHPIASFGTRMPEFINILCVFGTETARTLVDKVCGRNLGGITIVLLDAACRRSMRREIAEYFRSTKTGRNPFLLVDRVLFLYLVLHEPVSRLPLLLECTLPYTVYQPFTGGKGSTPDEMFFGRTRELNAIINPDGANFVYGGRQLGKTALLERAESLVNRPEKKEYAVYIPVMYCNSSSSFVEELIRGINKKTNINIGKSNNLRDFCDELDARFRKGNIAKLLLLIDEADNFLDSIREDSYKSIQPLVNLMRETGNRFKFVLAGLHNVFRARKAIAENGIFGQLGAPLCVKPLSPSEAYGLVTQPLRYLGFSTEETSYLETILTNTNYFPGILQYFGYTLVSNVNSEYAKYYGKNENPPFDLKEQMLGNIMNSTDLNDNIRQRLCATLELDARYFAIARCMAMLYFFTGNTDELRRGYTIAEMKETAEDFDIMRLADMPENEFAVLLEELQNMGIVIKNQSEERYRFRRRAFINIICKDKIEQLEKDIQHDNEELLA